MRCVAALLLTLTVIATVPEAFARPPHETKATRVRAREARKRLRQSEAGSIVLKAIKAHGGLRNWYGGGALKFEYDYKPVEGSRKTSTQVVDLMTSQVYHDVTSPVEGQMAWDGEQAWSTFPSSRKMPVRFWNLTPYYFVGLPFVLGDPGVNLQRMPDDSVAYGLPPSNVVKVTFDSETGDSPDDYYILYFSEKDSLLRGIRYIVTYEPFFVGSDRDQTPEKILLATGHQDFGPLKLATTHDFFTIIGQMKADPAAEARLRDVEYGVTFDESRLTMPEGAVVDTSMDEVE